MTRGDPVEEREASGAYLERFIGAEADRCAALAAAREGTTEENRRVWCAETVAERRARISQELFDAFGGVVRHGPFAGLRLAASSWWGSADRASMLFGLYELEVLSLLTGETLRERSRFVDVGAADGYYAVGLVRAGRFDEAFCFERSERGRDTIEACARDNGVGDRISVFGEADGRFHESLPTPVDDDAVVLLDVEGAEFDILDANCLEALSRAVVVVEIHDWVPDFERRYLELIRRAGKRFRPAVLPVAARDTSGFRELDVLPDDNRLLLCSEGRPNLMRWLVLVPR